MQKPEIKLQDPESRRITYIDGLKGVAAMIVLNNHLYPLLFHSSEMITEGEAFPPIFQIFYILLYILANGQFSVILFFILSGYLIGNRYYTCTSKQQTLISTAIRRCFTLVLPCAISILIGYLVVKFSLSTAHFVNPTYTVWLFEPDLLEAIRSGFFGIFIGEDLPHTYNVSLWTIRYELPGTFLVLALLGIAGDFSKRYWLYAGVAFFLLSKDQYHCYLVCFMIGLMIIDIEKNGKTEQKLKFLFHPILQAFLLVVGLVLTLDPIYNLKPLNTLFLKYDNAGLIRLILGVTMIFLVISHSNWLQKLLNARILRRIGQVSFSIYVSHLFILGTASSSIFLVQNQYISHQLARIVTILISYVIVFFVGILIHKTVNLPGIRMARYIEKKLLH